MEVKQCKVCYFSGSNLVHYLLHYNFTNSCNSFQRRKNFGNKEIKILLSNIVLTKRLPNIALRIEHVTVQFSSFFHRKDSCSYFDIFIIFFFFTYTSCEIDFWWCRIIYWSKCLSRFIIVIDKTFFTHKESNDWFIVCWESLLALLLCHICPSYTKTGYFHWKFEDRPNSVICYKIGHDLVKCLNIDESSLRCRSLFILSVVIPLLPYLSCSNPRVPTHKLT